MKRALAPVPGGEFFYYRGYLPAPSADELYHHCAAALAWEQPELLIAGRPCKVPRLTAWHGEEDATYTYSNRTFTPAPLTDQLRAVITDLTDFTGAPYNSALANWYRTGADSMGYHADDERELGPLPVIASLSLGATRRFLIKPRRGGPSTGLDLAAGDLVVMRGRSQRDYLHALPKSRRPVGPRINLTFRQIHLPEA